MNERPNGRPGFLDSWQQAAPLLIAAAFVWALVIGSIIIGFVSSLGIE